MGASVKPNITMYDGTRIEIEYKYKKSEYSEKAIANNIKKNNLSRVYYGIDKIINRRFISIIFGQNRSIEDIVKEASLNEDNNSEKYGYISGNINEFEFKYTIKEYKTDVVVILNVSMIGDKVEVINKAYNSMREFNKYYIKVLGNIENWLKNNKKNSIAELRDKVKDLNKIAELGVDFWYTDPGSNNKNISIQKYVYEIYGLGLDSFSAFRRIMAKYGIEIALPEVEVCRPKRVNSNISTVNWDAYGNKIKKDDGFEYDRKFENRPRKGERYREKIKRDYIRAYPELGNRKFIVDDTEVRIYNLFKGNITREIIEATLIIGTKPEIQFRKELGNRSKYFDFIEVEMSIRLSLGSYQDRKNACIKNMKALDQIVKRMVKSHRTFKANSVALNYFKVEKVLTKDSLLVYKFSLK